MAGYFSPSSSNYSYDCDFSEDLTRNSCYLTSTELAEGDAIAAIRMIASCLSFLGSLSIIMTAVAKKQVLSPKVHPIFILSVADLLLAILWTVGGSVWLRHTENRVWCYAISLPTVILECVAVNLTLVYAILEYIGIRQKAHGNLRKKSNPAEHTNVCHPGIIITGYIIAWGLPLLIIMILFGSVSGTTNLVTGANHCSCWCLPVFGNVLPYAFPRDESSALYYYELSKLIASYGLVLGTHYLVVFISLLYCYYKLLKHIKSMRTQYDRTHDLYHRSPDHEIIARGHEIAKRRVIAFITVFIFNGFFNFALSYGFMIVEGISLRSGVRIDPTDINAKQDSVSKAYVMVLTFQSITVPLQGFLNAIVYGWTRDDFINVMAFSNQQAQTVEELERSGRHNDMSTSCRTRYFISSGEYGLRDSSFDSSNHPTRDSGIQVSIGPEESDSLLDQVGQRQQVVSTDMTETSS